WYSEFQCTAQRRAGPDWVQQQLPGLRYDTVVAARVPKDRSGIFELDPNRFPRVAPLWIQAVLDTSGQIVLLSRKEQRILAILSGSRGIGEAWLPDGTRWNSTKPDPNAAARIGKILRDAEL